MRVDGHSAYPSTAPGARVRVTNMIPYLEPLGVDLRFLPSLRDSEYSQIISNSPTLRKLGILTKAAARLASKSFSASDSLTLIHRLGFLTPLPGLDPPGKLDIYDFDDALFLGSSMEVNRGFSWAKREASRWHVYTKRARLVLAGNDFLAARASEHAKWVEVVPSCVEPRLQPIREHSEQEVIRVGWIGSQSTSRYLIPCLPAFARLNTPRVRFELHILGGAIGVQEPWIKALPWSLEWEKDFLSRLDIGIMPLPDDDWAKGKCGYKLLQYFSAGVPAIANPVGVNANLVTDETGIRIDERTDWVKALESLGADVQMRRELGSNARQLVENHYSYSRWAPEVSSLFCDL